MNPLFNQSLEKGLSVLCSFSGKKNGMTITEVAEVCELNKSSAQRMIFTLTELGYLKKNPQTRRYQITVRALRPGLGYLSSNALIDIANPFLSELTNISQETTCLTEPDGLEMVYVARFISAKFVPVHMPIGSRLPMYCTSAGRAYLSALPEAESKDLIAKQNLFAHTPHTETNPNKIQEMLVEARKQGFTTNEEEMFLGDMTIGAPITRSDGKPIASIHVVAPTSRWTMAEAKKQLGPAVIACATALSNAVRRSIA